MARLSFRRLKKMAGQEVGLSDWTEITQNMIDAFADCTDDRQWIHVDEKRAGLDPQGGTVAHGFLLLSLLPHFNIRNQVFASKFRMAVNYGLNRVRFVVPVKAGCRVRNRALLKKVERRGFRKVLVTVDNSLEVEGQDKPAMVAEVLALIYL